MATHKYNDGGREAAGFKGKTGDCVARSIAIAAGLPYREVYDRLAAGNASQRVTKSTRQSMAGVKTARKGIYTGRKWFKDYMRSLGFEWVSLSEFGSTKALPLAYQLCIPGVVIAKQRRHYLAIIDGVCQDTYCESSVKTVYGYWKRATNGANKCL